MSINYTDIVNVETQENAVRAIETIARNLERIADALDSMLDAVEASLEEERGKPNGKPLG